MRKTFKPLTNQRNGLREKIEAANSGRVPAMNSRASFLDSGLTAKAGALSWDPSRRLNTRATPIQCCPRAAVNFRIGHLSA
jgi:hypothetical protein